MNDSLSIFFETFSHRVYAQRVPSKLERGEESWSKKN